jgi:hypothetical protein
MSLVGPLPYTIQNGQAVDAVPVMANFNYIVDGINAAIATSSAANIPSSRITYTAPEPGAVERTLYDKLQDVVSVCDFGVKGDGSDETTALQTALNSGAKWVSLSGKTIVAGTVTLPSGVGLIGDGGTLKAVPGIHWQILIPDGSTNSVIDGVTFDAAGITPVGSPDNGATCIVSATPSGTMSGLRLTNNRFLNIPTNLGQSTHAIQLNYGEAYVAGNYTPQCGGDIYNFNNGYFVVVGNIAKHTGDGGIAFNNDARGCIVGNYLYKCDLGIGAGPEGSTDNPDNTLLISSNEIVACSIGINMGWFAYSGRKGPRDAKVIGNTIANCKDAGLRYDGDSIDWAAYLTITGNTISGCGSTDHDGNVGDGFGVVVYCKYCVISGNTFHDNRGTDIVVGQQENIHVIGNAIDAGEYTNDGGQWADFSSSNGLVANNTASGRRLLIRNASGVRVIGNTLALGLQGQYQGAVVLDDSASNATVSENNFVNCGNAVYLANLAGWFSHDVLDSNKFVNCANKVTSSPLPVYGDSYVECVYYGDVDSNGQFRVAHGLARNGTLVMAAAGFFKGDSGESAPMTLVAADGTYVTFSTDAKYAGRQCRAWVRYNKDAVVW